MKVKDAVKIIGGDWVRRRKGFRVHLQKRVNSEWVTDYIPDEKETPWTSEIATWELARRLAEATKSDSPKINDGDIVNIYVVDDLGNPVAFYGTNQSKVFNYKDTGKA